MRARVIYLGLGKSVRYVLGIKPIIWSNVACPTSYVTIPTSALVEMPLLETSERLARDKRETSQRLERV